jgi:hypothetical protein
MISPSAIRAFGIQIDWPKEGDPLGQGRLAVARRAVEKHADPGVDRGAQAGEQAWMDRDVAKRLLELLPLGRLGRDGLGVDRGHVVAQRHRRRAEVGAGVIQNLGVFAPLDGQRVRKVIKRRRPPVRHQLASA